ncbi:MAG: DUF5615 family PIN-like protein [Planctomycetaceae bacterium]|nr:DUF5615 family PIN-like protein [Planctomycetaceae bacterium]
MSVPLYMDVHVHAAITEQLELRKVDVLTAQDDSRADSDDERLLDRATELGRALFSQDRDFLAIAADRQRRRHNFAGIVYGHPLRVSIGQCVHDLELISKCYEPADLQNRVEHLPL